MRNTLDLATLRPGLNHDFPPWACFEAGEGITCQGNDDATCNEPLGLFCYGQAV